MASAAVLTLVVMTAACSAASGAVAAGLHTSGRDTTAMAAPLVFRATFEQEPVLDGGQVVHAVQGGFAGTELRASGGAIALVPGPGGGRVARFPSGCTGRECPRVVIEIADDPALDPGPAAFSFGARLRMPQRESAQGMNVMQKGRYRTQGGQWKLQVDNRAGQPSCVFRSGPGSRPVIVVSTLSVTDGAWHDVRCVRTTTAVAVVVDRRTTRRATAAVDIDNGSAVLIGGNALAATSDQFYGSLDSVFLRIDP